MDLFLKKYEDFAIFTPKFTQNIRRVVCNKSRKNSKKVIFSNFVIFVRFFFQKMSNLSGDKAPIGGKKLKLSNEKKATQKNSK